MHLAMDTYYLQAIVIALAIIFVVAQNRKIDIYPLFAVSGWLIGVSLIYGKYGTDQVNFYSNDQSVHLRIMRIYIENEGFNFHSIIPLRYLITYPTFLLSKIGLDEVLVLKTIQIVSLIGIYFKSKGVLTSTGISLKFWHFAFISSPLMFFFSLLALRDLTLALFTICFVFEYRFQRRVLFVILIFLLKPHLAIALVFGHFALFLLKSLRSKFNLLHAFLFSVGSYLLGSYTFSVGSYFKDGFFPGFASGLFSQRNISQILLNFSGLQFFSLINDQGSIVSASTQFLLFARIILFDSFLIPLSFLITTLFFLRKLKNESFLIFISFVFYLGLVSQTDFNSTRQNIPFIAAMGLVSVVNIDCALSLYRKKPLR
jgi:hypothetical protein